MPEPIVGVRIRGLSAFRRALNKADRDLAKFVRVRIKQVVVPAAERARQLAYQHNERRTGDLGRGIKPYVRQRSVGIRSGAVHDGYEYPRRLEFEGRKGNLYGPRASLYPASVEAEKTIEGDALRVFDQIADDLSGSPL